MLKRLFLIRHAKSSWDDPGLEDFYRPLNKRGKKDAPDMAARLAARNVTPDRIVSSPAKRARKTAIKMAKGTGYSKDSIVYDKLLYLGSRSSYLRVIEDHFREIDVLFLVGHNHTLTDLAEYLAGISLVNVPTSGIVALDYDSSSGFVFKAGAGKMLFFDFPKNRNW
jgi:phosphohistidine phosphatase